MSKTVLITGGTGLVGSRLTELLLQKGYQVAYLSRNSGIKNGITLYKWDLERQEIDDEAIRKADYIIHLAGAGVADKRWTIERKQEILNSRVASTALLKKKLDQAGHHVKAVISASAIGIYGFDTGAALIDETSPAGKDFLADVTKQWEEGVEKIGLSEREIRIVKLRIGIVLSNKGGALEKILQPIKLGVGAALGSGEQYMSWIHIDDLCNMFIHAIENDYLNGSYNAVAPNPVTNEHLTKAAAQAAGKKLIMPNVPEFILRIIVGEMAKVVIGGSKISSSKIEASGFTFKYIYIEQAVEDLIKD